MGRKLCGNGDFVREKKNGTSDPGKCVSARRGGEGKSVRNSCRREKEVSSKSSVCMGFRRRNGGSLCPLLGVGRYG